MIDRDLLQNRVTLVTKTHYFTVKWWVLQFIVQLSCVDDLTVDLILEKTKLAAPRLFYVQELQKDKHSPFPLHLRLNG
jgi:hypothetical protein